MMLWIWDWARPVIACVLPAGLLVGQAPGCRVVVEELDPMTPRCAVVLRMPGGGALLDTDSASGGGALLARWLQLALESRLAVMLQEHGYPEERDAELDDEELVARATRDARLRTDVVVERSDSALTITIDCPSGLRGSLLWQLLEELVSGDLMAPQQDADLFARARAWARLEADSTVAMFPGDVLEARARVALWLKGDPRRAMPESSPEVLRGCRPQDVAAAWDRALGVSPVTVVFLGPVAAADRAACDRVAARCGVRGPPSVSPPAAVRGVEPFEEVHLHSVGPFAAWAFPVRECDRALLAFAVQIAGRRAVERWAPTGSEAASRAPFVRYRQGSPVVLLLRRGPRRLGPADGLARARADLAALFQDLRERPVAKGEFDAVREARSAARDRLPLDPELRSLLERRVLLIPEYARRIARTEDDGEPVSQARLSAFLAELFDPRGAVQGALLPREDPGRHPGLPAGFETR